MKPAMLVLCCLLIATVVQSQDFSCQAEQDYNACVDCCNYEAQSYVTTCQVFQCDDLPEPQQSSCDEDCFYQAVRLRSTCYGYCDQNYNQGGTGSPILVQLGAGRPHISDLANGVMFDLDGDGVPQLVSWPYDAPFLVVDSDGSGYIESGVELFGNYSPQNPLPGESRNGFVALRNFDRDDDGLISKLELGPLLLWWDIDRDGSSDDGEIVPALQLLQWISISYSTSSGRDRYGNLFTYSSMAALMDGRHIKLTDVFLLMD